MTISFTVFFLLVIALSMDAFTAGLSYGASNVHVPFLSLLITAFTSALMLTLSLFAGNFLISFIPALLMRFISFFVLLLLAFYKLYDSLHQKKEKDLVPTTDSISDKINKADKNVLSPGEAFLLALALSIDNITAGVSTGSAFLTPLPVFLTALFIHLAAIRAGALMGALLSRKTSYNFSWIGAVLLLFLAVLRLL